MGATDTFDLHPPKNPMLIAISDLHLTDGTTAANPHETAIELLMRELEASIGAKKPTELRFLLLGDIYDLVRTDYWHSRLVPADERPWGGKALDKATGMNPFPGVETQFQDVLARILPQPSSQALIGGIKQLAEKSGLPTTVHYIRGNHDRVLNNFPSLERQISETFAPVKVEFSNELHAPVRPLRAPRAPVGRALPRLEVPDEGARHQVEGEAVQP